MLERLLLPAPLLFNRLELFFRHTEVMTDFVQYHVADSLPEF